MKTGKDMWKNYGKGVDSLGDDEKMIGFFARRGGEGFYDKDR